MKTMIDKYYHDPKYRQGVDIMLSLILNNEFTPSEMREMAVCASIKYEEMRLSRAVYLDQATEDALKTLREVIGDKND